MNEQIKLEYLHMCDYACQAINNKIDLIGIFDYFTALKAPDFFIAARISVPINSKYVVSFDIISKEDNKRVYADPNPITIPDNAPGLNYNILKSMKNVDFKNFGEFSIRMFVNNLPLEDKIFTVKNGLNNINIK